MSSANKSRALIVEDDGSSRTAMRYLLDYHGWDAAEAGSLTQAAALLIAERFDALILDLMLPDGDGTDLLRRIRADALPVRVAVLTGVGDPDVLHNVSDLRPDILFRKPINVQALLQWLDGVKA